jgi:hypothetical protein
MIAEWVRCTKCDRNKAPIGRSVPLEMCYTLCTPPKVHECADLVDGCEGYYLSPRPDCRWPGESLCGPGCDKK